MKKESEEKRKGGGKMKKKFTLEEVMIATEVLNNIAQEWEENKDHPHHWANDAPILRAVIEKIEENMEEKT